MGFELDPKRGVFNYYGVRKVDSKFGGFVDDDVIQTADWTFFYNDLPTSGVSNLQYSIPANSRIIDVRLEIITAFTSTSTTTTLLGGLATSAGVAISGANGLVLAGDATAAAIAVVGRVITGTGALVLNTIGATAGELVVTSSAADLLTGKARLLVRYIKAGV